MAEQLKVERIYNPRSDLGENFTRRVVRSGVCLAQNKKHNRQDVGNDHRPLKHTIHFPKGFAADVPAADPFNQNRRAQRAPVPACLTASGAR